ncbi:MAG: indolepyruvate ferredoxin oxidoreductase subunit alpha [Promethearchaeota archaeon]|jgi:UDP-glucose 4-epimerase
MEKIEEIEFLFKKMMEDFEEISRSDEIYRRDIKDLGKLKIQWRLSGVLGYQILELDNYSYKFGERLEDPDITFTWRDPDETIKFLKGESFQGFNRIPLKEYKHMFRYRYITGWKEADRGGGQRRVRLYKTIMSARFKKEKPYHPFVLTKLPMFRNTRKRAAAIPGEEINNYGSYIPINQSLGTFESEVLPVKVFKHFIDKASNIVFINKCPCRVYRACEAHTHDIGCMYMGDDTLNMLITEEKGRVVSKEEALKVVKDAVDDGLIPLLGRATGESMSFGVDDTGHFTVAVDEALCKGCGECLKVCKFRGRELIDEKANVNEKWCLGCGRCEEVCPNNAITISIENENRVNELIELLESYVDVAPQGQ